MLKKHSWGLFSWHPENKYHQDYIMPGDCAKSQNILLLQIHKYSNLQGKEYNGFKIPLELPCLPQGRCSWGQIRKATKYQITFKRSPVGSKWTERSLVWDELPRWETKMLNLLISICWPIFCIRFSFDERLQQKITICRVIFASVLEISLRPW